jgi:hypothetical protein
VLSDGRATSLFKVARIALYPVYRIHHWQFLLGITYATNYKQEDPLQKSAGHSACQRGRPISNATRWPAAT